MLKLEAVHWFDFLNLAYSVKKSAYVMSPHYDGTPKSLIYTSQRHQPNFVTSWPIVMSSQPNYEDQSVWCVASALTIELGCGY